MFFKSFKRSSLFTLLAIFYVSHQAIAQTDEDPACGRTDVVTTINTSTNLQAIASCSTFLGSLSIGAPYEGEFDLENVEEIRGNLTIQNAGNITKVTGAKLLRIGGTFEISNVTRMNTLSFPSLDSVGRIVWFALQAMDVIDFKKGISSVTEVSISNTFLSTLAGINLKNADSVTISNNNRLRVADMALETVKNYLEISANGRNLAVSLPNLGSAGKIILRNVSSVELPSLKLVADSFILTGSYVEELVLANLSVVTFNIIIQNNSRLINLTLNELLSGNAVWIQNNTKLGIINLPKFARADSFTSIGNFSELKMPALTTVKDFTSLTSFTSFDCSPFDRYRKNNIIQGSSYSCQSKTVAKSDGASPDDATGTNNNTITDPNTPNDPIIPAPGPGISNGAIGGIVVGIVVVIVAIGTFLFLRRRKNAKVKAANDASMGIGVDGKAEMGSGEVKRTEMPAGGHEVYEAEGQHGVSEVVDGREAKITNGTEGQVHELVGSEPVLLPKDGQVK